METAVVVEPERVPIRQKSNDPRSNISNISVRTRPTTIQTSGVRTNLITVPIQDSAPPVHETNVTQHNYYNYQNTTYAQALPPMHIPPPQQPQYYAAPPAYSPAQTYNYSAGNGAAAQYGAPAQGQARAQFDYSSAPPPQWNGGQQYYR